MIFTQAVVRSSFLLGFFRLFCLVLLFFLSFEIVAGFVVSSQNTLSESKICNLHPLVRRSASRHFCMRAPRDCRLPKIPSYALICSNQDWRKASQYYTTSRENDLHSLLTTSFQTITFELKSNYLYFRFFSPLSQAELLDHSRTPCTNPKDFVPDTKNKIYLFYIRMDRSNDYTTWINVARCFRIWDLDARGFHKSLWRMWVKGNHVLYIGCPASPYCTHKPNDSKPIYMPNRETRPADENR